MTARFKEIVKDPGFLNAQHFLPNLGDCFFHFVSRCGIRCSPYRFYLKRKQLAAVHFSAWRERNFCDFCDVVRHHVVRKVFCRVFPQTRRSKFASRFLHNIRTNLKISLGIRLRQDDSFGNIRRLLKHGFNFSKLNAVSANFDLIIFSS